MFLTTNTKYEKVNVYEKQDNESSHLLEVEETQEYEVLQQGISQVE